MALDELAHVSSFILGPLYRRGKLKDHLQYISRIIHKDDNVGIVPLRV